MHPVYERCEWDQSSHARMSQTYALIETVMHESAPATSPTLSENSRITSPLVEAAKGKEHRGGLIERACDQYTAMSYLCMCMHTTGAEYWSTTIQKESPDWYQA